ncbi:unnamed protein product [Diplocarpon coronariae]
MFVRHALPEIKLKAPYYSHPWLGSSRVSDGTIPKHLSRRLLLSGDSGTAGCLWLEVRFLDTKSEVVKKAGGALATVTATVLNELGSRGFDETASDNSSLTSRGKIGVEESREKGKISADVLGLEVEDGTPMLFDADENELTPVEAFTWNVDGDQSPCKISYLQLRRSCQSLDSAYRVRGVVLWHEIIFRLATCSVFHTCASTLLVFSRHAQQPSLFIGYIVAQILIFPIGRASKKMPRWRVPLGPLTFDFTPGPFTIKEHALIVILSPPLCQRQCQHGLCFAAVTPMLFHTYLYNGREIWARFKNARNGGEDVHRRLMIVYREVPDWWHATLTLVVLALGAFIVRYWDSGLSIRGFCLRGKPGSLNIVSELIAGYARPGKPIANMMVKCYGDNSIKHGLDFAQDLKLGQYVIYSTLLATATQTGGRFDALLVCATTS